MPTDERILGFSNRWYGPAIGAAQTIRVGRHDIRVVTTPYFLATKLEAFHGRGGHDYRASHDLEDIITVIDGRPELGAEVRAADADVRDYIAAQAQALLSVRDYIAAQAQALLSTRDFRDALPGHLAPDLASQGRLALVRDRLNELAKAGTSR